MEPAHSETGDGRVEPPASILVARLSMSHLVPLLEFNQGTARHQMTGRHASASSVSRIIYLAWNATNNASQAGISVIPPSFETDDQGRMTRTGCLEQCAGCSR